jgi:hypothetical protein
VVWLLSLVRTLVLLATHRSDSGVVREFNSSMRSAFKIAMNGDLPLIDLLRLRNAFEDLQSAAEAYDEDWNVEVRIPLMLVLRALVGRRNDAKDRQDLSHCLVIRAANCIDVDEEALGYAEELLNEAYDLLSGLLGENEQAPNLKTMLTCLRGRETVAYIRGDAEAELNAQTERLATLRRLLSKSVLDRLPEMKQDLMNDLRELTAVLDERGPVVLQ